MLPEISEFSYGFALTNEMVGWTALSAAPVFPSLIEEGKKGGGYDLKLDQPGMPLYLQFKRADCMMRSSVSEIKHHDLPLSIPFYRFPITQRNKSFQHTSLVELDDGSNLVFYAAPRFHLISEINRVWMGRDIAARSIFLAPSAIGLIRDDERHHVSYDAGRTYFCSEPFEITPLSAVALQDIIKSRLSSESKSVRETLPSWLANIRESRKRARQTQLEIEAVIEAQKKSPRAATTEVTTVARDLRVQIGDEYIVPSAAGVSGPEIRAQRRLSEDERTLRAISDEALQGFGAQFFVVQK